MILTTPESTPARYLYNMNTMGTTAAVARRALKMFDPDHPPLTAEIRARAAQLSAVLQALWAAHPDLRRAASDPAGVTQALQLYTEMFSTAPLIACGCPSGEAK